MHSPIRKVDICTLSESKAEDVMISRFSEYLERHADLVAPHRHSFYHLLFFTEGGGQHTIDFHHFPVRPFQIYFMSPEQVHSWDFEGRVEGYVVNFSEDFFTSFLLRQEYLEAFSFFRGSPQNSVLNLVEPLASAVSTLFEELLQFTGGASRFREDMARLLLLQIFIRVQNGVEAGHFGDRPAVHNALLRTYQKLIEQHFLTVRLPGHYAQMLHVTPNHLNALCKEHLGAQAGKLIRDRVLLEAKRMLINLDLPISQIAYRLNFSDNSYFSKFFKKETRLSPEGFRSRNTRS